MVRVIAWAQRHRVLLTAGMLVAAAVTGSRDLVWGM